MTADFRPGRGPVIGIDLGTRNALCACLNGTEPVVIPNRWGSAATPSAVGWNGDWIVGEDAVRYSLRESGPVWWDLKRKVGGDFRAVCGGKTYRAEDLLAHLLCALREDAEVFLGRFVSSCVLAVPACFTLSQREALTRSAEAAGLRQVRIVAEPAAAALAFGEEGRFLVLDFGAGTADFSVVESEDGVWQVLETTGSGDVGGYDFDLALAEWLRERINAGPLSPEDPLWRALVLEAEKIKIALSSSDFREWTSPFPDRAPVRVTREDLERMTRFSIRRLSHAARRLWERYEPERLLLAGGSSRIPLLREILEREAAPPERHALCPEDAIAVGAALCAGRGEERLLLDVLSGDIGVIWEGEPQIVAASGTPVPFTARVSLVSRSSGKSGKIELPVFQTAAGESERKILTSLELDVTEGAEIELRCQLSLSGLARFSAGRFGEMTEAPRLAQTARNKPLSARRRLRGLKLRLIPLETALSSRQADRLHAMVCQIETAEDDERALDLLESVVEKLEAALRNDAGFR